MSVTLCQSWASAGLPLAIRHIRIGEKQSKLAKENMIKNAIFSPHWLMTISVTFPATLLVHESHTG